MANETPLRWLRRAVFGATQDELGAILGVHRSRVSRYERGDADPPLSHLRRIRDEAHRRQIPFCADWFFERPPQPAEGDAEQPEGVGL